MFILIQMLLLAVARAEAELLVVMQKDAPIEQLDRHQVVDIFMGRNSMLDSGVKFKVFDQANMSDLRQQFYRQLVNRSLTQIDAYWARLLFSGRTTPPVKIDVTDDLVEQVLRTPGGIAYIARQDLVDELKVVYEFSNTK
ncbi:hypothetical protein [Shewanella sp. NIFS-20-20]|uniref:hypothetical protein n=1 Tax=Shewanella sp. NIFS-20-20 TaxID=2853806 RepID=UPI001C44F01F|nr:hypothetical protein [Shewanella sp. NIFS-20-20]MBV7314087.1 hypothetical protein [Shewanella sp. NIFS-20-20]